MAKDGILSYTSITAKKSLPHLLAIEVDFNYEILKGPTGGKYLACDRCHRVCEVEMNIVSFVCCAGEYHFSNFLIEGVEMHQRSANDPGQIVIGGDKGDVFALHAIQQDEGVCLHDVTLKSMDGLSLDEASDIVMEIVQSCYASIGKDTFSKQREKKR